MLKLLQDIEYQKLQDKAVDLKTHLNNPEWLQIIGIGLDNDEPCIFVYVNKLNLARNLVPSIWHNIPVKIRKIKKLNPVVSFL